MSGQGTGNKPNIALVTGGAGFIGSHMVDLLLEAGFEVRVIDNLSSGRKSNLAHHSNNPRLKVEFEDIRTLSINHSIYKNIDYAFHFAGIGDIVPSIEKPAEYLSVNVQGTVQVLEGLRNSKIKKFIYAASSSCYGLADVPTLEIAPISPQYPYALSKYLGEQVVFHWGAIYRMPANSIRMFNVYGPRVRTTGAYGAVFGVFLKQKLARKPFTVVGDGTQRRDFIYASDVAKAFLMLAQSEKSQEIYNVGAGKPQSINYLVDLIGGSNVSVVYVPKRPGEPDCTWADISKIKSHTRWYPEVSFEEGVSRMLQNISDWQDAPLWDERSIRDATAQWFAALSG